MNGHAVFSVSVDLIAGRVAHLGPAMNPTRTAAPNVGEALGVNWGSNSSHFNGFHFGNDVLNFVAPYATAAHGAASTIANTAPASTTQRGASPTDDYSYVCC